MLRLPRLLVLVAVGMALCTLRLPEAKIARAAAVSLYVELGDGTVGDIFAYSPTSGFKALSTYGYNTVPVLSPDGKYIAYGSYAKTYITDPGRSGAPAVNIWLMETATGDAKRIADQPPDNRSPGDARIRPFLARTDPVWSPDSKSLAWLEDAGGTRDGEEGQNDHLILYTLASGKSVEVYEQPVFAAGCPCSSLTWTAEGISVVYASNPNGPYTLRILDTTGKIRSETKFDQYPSIQWLSGESTPTIVTNDELITPGDGSRSKTLPALEVYSLSAPDGVRFRSDVGFFGANWAIIPPASGPVTVGKISSFAISPDGKMAAYIAGDDNSLYLFDGSKANEVDLSGVKVRNIQPLQAQGLAWSPLGVRKLKGQ